MFGSRNVARRREHARDRPERRREAPAEAEHPRHPDADEARLGRVDGRGAEREPDLRELEERPQHDDGAEADRDRADVAVGDRDAADVERPAREGALDRLHLPVQIQVMSPLSSRRRPIVTITTRICELRSTGPDHRLVDADAAEERRRRA